jgi:hypothetical protein
MPPSATHAPVRGSSLLWRPLTTDPEPQTIAMKRNWKMSLTINRSVLLADDEGEYCSC